MKKFLPLNTVERKIMVGYGIVGIFSVVFMITAVLCNQYISTRYAAAISQAVSVNELEIAAEQLNNSVNAAYLFLEDDAIVEYASCRIRLESGIEEVQEDQERDFVREVTDTVKTVETYVEKSDVLIQGLEQYFAGKSRSNYNSLEEAYNEVQDVYSYVALRFQSAYSVELSMLSRLEQKLNRLQYTITFLQILLLAAALLVSMFYLVKVIRQVSRSIVTLRSGVERMQENAQKAEPIVIESGDEFEEFAEAFNDMTKIIQMQMQELEETADIKEQLAEMEIKNLRMFGELQKSHLDFLQSRVNPHFLFNTLNMISSLARIENADKCAELMETTAAFLRYNLDNISKTVTLEKEVKNLQDYVAIQECRYGGRYTYSFDIDPECLNFPMPCMILQPLVENAIQHGLAMMMEGGAVKIHIFSRDDRVCLDVCDNGVGMTEDQISDIQEAFYENQSSTGHIGIRNIYRRLRIFYDEDVQFDFQNLNPGLRILISLPRGEGNVNGADNGAG